jgi:hypothetical protein
MEIVARSPPRKYAVHKGVVRIVIEPTDRMYLRRRSAENVGSIF